MTGLPSSVITMSDYMRVSHRETSKLKIPHILKIFWPAWEPCREATSEYSDSIFPLRILRILTYQPSKYEGMGMHCVDTLVCQSETSKLKIPQILKIFWPAWEPCREATSEYSDSIFPVRILRILTYQPCKYEGMGMHCLSFGEI